jgi:hypothetical protein
MVRPPNLQAGIADDITLADILTIDPARQKNWSKQAPLRWAIRDTLAGYVPDAVRACHEKRMQIFAGIRFELKKAKDAVAFNEWLMYLAAQSAEERTWHINDAAANLVKVAKDNAFDGVAPDIEYFGSFVPPKGQKDGDKIIAALLTQLYQTVAALAPDLVFAPAIGAMVADGGYSFVNPPNPPVLGTPNIRVQPYAMAHEPMKKKTLPAGGAATSLDSFPNMILRPMGYDAFRFTESEGPPTATGAGKQKVLNWHEQVVKYALTEPKDPGDPNAPGVLPGQFQLGIKTFPGPNNRFDPPSTTVTSLAGPAAPAGLEQRPVETPASPAGPPAVPSPGKGAVYKYDAIVEGDKGYLLKTARMLRKYRVGMILFAFPDVGDGKGSVAQAAAAGYWKKCALCNFVLNAITLPPESFDIKGEDPDYDPKNPSRGTIVPGQRGEPLQVPLDDTALKRFQL